MEQKRIKLKDIAQNTGQVKGLPSNPRTWTRDELDRLKASIEETPELLEARGIIVYPHKGKYIAMGGNMRLAALTEMGAKDAPCIVLPEDTTIDKLKEIVIKDNGKFGWNDWDKLADEWSDLPLTEWGIPVWENENEEDDEMPTDIEGIKKDNPFVCKITFKDADTMTRFIEAYKNVLEEEFGCIMSESGGAL